MNKKLIKYSLNKSKAMFKELNRLKQICFNCKKYDLASYCKKLEIKSKLIYYSFCKENNIFSNENIKVYNFKNFESNIKIINNHLKKFIYKNKELIELLEFYDYEINLLRLSSLESLEMMKNLIIMFDNSNINIEFIKRKTSDVSYQFNNKLYGYVNDDKGVINVDSFKLSININNKKYIIGNIKIINNMNSCYGYENEKCTLNV